MSRPGKYLDNAMAERGGAPAWPTRASARRALFEWIEVWCHRRRRHSALAYQAPVAWEELLMLQDQAAWRKIVRESGPISFRPRSLVHGARSSQ
jgi:transposase InsO family protein